MSYWKSAVAAAAIAALSVTGALAQTVKLGIVNTSSGPFAAVVSYWRVAADLGSLLVGMLALLLLLGTLIWLVERPGLAGKEAQEDNVATLRDGLYWAVVTMTTVGYGNLVPAANPGQTLAVLEALIGQLFLVVAVGKIISTYRPRRQG